MNETLTGATRPLAAALAVLFAAACTDTEPTAPTAPSAEEVTALFSAEDVDLEDQGAGIELEENSTFFPASTNALNKAREVPDRVGQDAPYVVFEDVGEGEVTLEFVNNTNSLAFFEFRIDGETVGDVDHPVVNEEFEHPTTGETALIDDVIHPGVSLDGRGEDDPVTESRTFTADETVDIRLALGGERDWDFDWTTFYVEPAPTCFVDVVRFDEESGETETVADFNSIQEAEDFAEPGDTLLVEGVCEEIVEIRTAGITVTSEQIDEIMDVLGDPGVIVERDRGEETLTGASTLEDAVEFPWAATVDGRLNVQASNVTVSGLKVTGSGIGVVIGNFRNDVELTRNFVYENGSWGIDVRGNNEGISIHRNWIGENRFISLNQRGGGTPVVDIHRNTIASDRARQGILVQTGTGTIHRNWVTGHGEADIRTMDDSTVGVHRNLIVTCDAEGDSGDGWHRNDTDECDQ